VKATPAAASAAAGVHDFDDALARVRAEGGQIEAEYRDQGPMPAAFCSDPFGNGFCVIGARR
jgi:predicted enzyme related to lactoylglutathione lyase